MHHLIAVATCLAGYLFALGFTLEIISLLRVLNGKNSASLNSLSPELRAVKIGLSLLLGGVAGTAILEQLPIQAVPVFPSGQMITLLGAWTGWRWWRLMLHPAVRA